MKHILVASCGTTPHVLTEALWALANQSRISCEEVYVITTSACQHFLTNAEFLSCWKTLQRVLHPYPIPPLRPSNIIIVRDNLDIAQYGDHVLALFHRLTQSDDTAVHVSFAGGRKEMSVLLAYGLSLFGRPQDKLYHVVASDEFIASGQYFPSEPHSTAVLLWEIPYVRLRKRIGDLVLGQKVPSYVELVHQTQRELDIAHRPLTITLDLKRKQLCVEGIAIKLSYMECAVYYWVISSSQQGRTILWGKQMADEDWLNFLGCYRYILTLHYRRRTPPYSKDTDIVERYGLLQKVVSLIKKKLQRALPDSLATYAAIRSDGCYGRKRLIAPSHVTVIPEQ